ncbi:MAG: zinc dependent phospholipase C family protein [Alkalispirochaeta sp.]
MPSHISHALLAEDVLQRVDTPDVTWNSRVRAILIAGAQGPDFFLHNHRRTPRGFRYGALLHRKGNAPLLRSLAVSAVTTDCKDDLTAYALGYITHVWFDRIAHPYINWSAGWRGTPDDHPDRPAMHAFLERLIDVQLLRLLKDQSVAEYSFARRLPRQASDFFRMRGYLVAALQAALVSAADDGQLPRRLLNALHDSLAFYKFTEAPDERYFSVARLRERRGEVSSRWLAVVHPAEEAITVDAINLGHRPWSHPCDPGRTSTADMGELFEEARARSLSTFETWLRAVQEPSEGNLQAILEDVGEENLNDGIATDPPCRRTFCEPLPLIDLYRDIKIRFDR